MRAVMPRILRNGEGQPVKEAAMPEAAERRSLEEGTGQGRASALVQGQTSPTLPAAPGRIGRLGGVTEDAVKLSAFRSRGQAALHRRLRYRHHKPEQCLRS